jgi:hypothetical protein
MAELKSTLETTEYRIVLVEPHRKMVLVLESNGTYCLPGVWISRNARPVELLVNSVEIELGLKVLILDFLSEPDDPTPCVAAVVLDATQARLNLLPMPLGDLQSIELTEKEQDCLHSIVYDRAPSPLSRVGWIDEAVTWVEKVTRKNISSRADIKQFNAGGGFALIRFVMEDDDCYWLKATGEPNHHERTLTALLSDHCPDVLPRLIAQNREWNAWLSAQAGSALPASPTAEAMACAAEGFLTLQAQTLDFVDDLFAAGAFDQRSSMLKCRIEPIIAYLIQAMERQESTNAPALCRDRLLELGEILKRSCISMEELGIPDALNHNDLNRGNILVDRGRFTFIDWSEAAIGNPFLACERLSQLNLEHRLVVHSHFRRSWSERIDVASIAQAFLLAPLLAIYAYLYGRGNWPRVGNTPPQFDSYARSLARHMDRAAQDPELRGMLCI